MKLLLDYDIIAYRAGFAGQTTYYYLDDMTFSSKRELNTYLGEAEVEELEDVWQRIQSKVEMEPIENILHSVKMMIEEAIENTKADEYVGYLSGKGNFRHELVDYYKANRKDNSKPLAYEDIVSYLLAHHKAEVVEGMEADDKLGIEQTDALYQTIMYPEHNHGTTIATIDKDLNMIPGWHYNFISKEWYWQDEYDAMMCFYTQLLTGDTTDNIRGVAGIGKQKAAKILEGCTNELNAYRRCQQTYVDAHRKRVEKLGLEMSERALYHKAMEDLRENANLLWIVRELDEDGAPVLWQPPVGEEDGEEDTVQEKVAQS